MNFNLEKSITNHKTILHGGIYSAKVDNHSQIIDFSSNVNPLGFPNIAKNLIKKYIQLFSVYPDPNSSKLRESLEKYTGISKNQIVVGNGATEIIYNFCKIFIRQKSRIIIPIPTFGEYEIASRLQGGQIFHLKTMDLNKNISELSDMISEKNCLFLCNPNNPTGVLIPKKQMIKIIEKAYNKSALVFLDECFIELATKSNETMVDYIKEFDNLFILRSLTKSFGLAGLRIGYGLSNKKMIDLLSKIKIPWNVNGLAQAIAVETLDKKFHLVNTRKLIKKELNFLTTSISKMNNFSCYPSSVNFVLIKSKINSDTLQKKLLEKGILVRDCSNFLGLDNKFVRIAVRTHKENVRLVKALGEI